jgi:hypothetical protein
MSDQSYKDDDLVYVNPKTRTVVGRVEFDKNDKPKSLEMKIPDLSDSSAETDSDQDDSKMNKKKGRKPRKPKKRYYPWGTYRSMKKIYRLEGKVKEEEGNQTLAEVFKKPLEETFLG